MGRLHIRKKNEKGGIWKNVKFCIDFVIFICCLIITFNIRPISNTQKNVEDNNISEKSKMIYVFHDYYWNKYILNDMAHGAASDWSYLFEDEVPEDFKWNNDNSSANSVSLWWMNSEIDENKTNSEQYNDDTYNGDKYDGTTFEVKDNQISSDDIFSDLWIDENRSWNEYNIGTWNENMLIISLSEQWSNKTKHEENNDYYTAIQTTWVTDDNTLIIEKVDNSIEHNNHVSDSIDYDSLTWLAKVFTFTSEWWILPILIPWDELQFGSEWMQSIGYIDNLWFTGKNKSGITIIDDYADCMTPRWYKIVHWDSVLAYKQIDNTPDICNIERRFCWNGKLSWTYTQQWCSINKNYTYEQWWEAAVVHTNEEKTKSDVVQNPDWSVTVNKPLWTWSFVFERPSQTSTPEYHVSNNVRNELEVEQTKRPHWDCVTPWWEEVKHWQFVQAFKHSNWFSDAPCIAQIRLCSMWDLMWTYTQSSCKTRDTSLIDWVNWSPTRDSFSEEKLEWVRKQIKTEEKNYNNARKNLKETINFNAPVDEILSILDKN